MGARSTYERGRDLWIGLDTGVPSGSSKSGTE